MTTAGGGGAVGLVVFGAGVVCLVWVVSYIYVGGVSFFVLGAYG